MEILLADNKEVKAGEAGLKMVNEFMNIQIGKHKVSASFWMNNDPDLKNTEMFKAVPNGGKMSPSGIAKMSIKVLDEKNLISENMSDDQIRFFNRQNCIGVDCSGFSYQLVKHIYEEIGGIDFDQKIVGVNNLHGITKVNSDFLTNDFNSMSITDVNQIKSGDLIRGMGGIHSLVVASRNGDWIRCAHSSDGVPAVGVSTFDIHIIKKDGGILDQYWSERNSNGIYFNERLRDKSKPGDGIRRLTIMQEQYLHR